MRIDKGNIISRRNTASVPLCSTQIPHDQTWDPIHSAVMGTSVTAEKPAKMVTCVRQPPVTAGRISIDPTKSLMLDRFCLNLSV
jgi:hypothetical protein